MAAMTSRGVPWQSVPRPYQIVRNCTCIKSGAPASTVRDIGAARERAVVSEKTSRISGFHTWSVEDRIARVAEFAGLDEGQRGQVAAPSNIDAQLGDHMIENFVTTIAIPVGVATNLKVDDRDVLVPMATEESSVVAAVGNSARPCYDSGGFTTSMSGTEMLAQIQLLDIAHPHHPPPLILQP